VLGFDAFRRFPPLSGGSWRKPSVFKKAARVPGFALLLQRPTCGWAVARATQKHSA
jgi:hypothetical protein